MLWLPKLQFWTFGNLFAYKMFEYRFQGVYPATNSETFGKNVIQYYWRGQNILKIFWRGQIYCHAFWRGQ